MNKNHLKRKGFCHTSRNSRKRKSFYHALWNNYKRNSFYCALCARLGENQGRDSDDICSRCEMYLINLMEFHGIKVCYNEPVITVRNGRYDPHHHNGDGIDCFCTVDDDYIGPDPTEEYLENLANKLNMIRDTNLN